MKKSELFKALSDETRLRLLNLFIQSKKPLCVCELTDALNMPQYQVSKHLSLLKHLGFINSEKQGKWNYYSQINDNSVNSQLFIFLHGFLNDTQFEQDWQYLQKRLSLRENDLCTIGSVAAGELDNLLQKKIKC